jgi:hypothetical protein
MISARADAENVALLAEYTQNNCGRRSLLSAVLARKSPFSVRHMVFSWQSDIPSHIF